ncbi:MAG: DUF4861 family protein [Marinilabiliaceae bacterium]|nr:DUF4861 family protein [Marinilabiliaceae bacterium]
MRKLIIGLFFLSVISTSCAYNSAKVIITNTSDVNLNEKVVVLSRILIEEKLGKSANDLVYVQCNKESLSSQCDDIDGDGKWDELSFIIGLKAGESKQLVLKEASAEQMPVFLKRTNIRFGEAYAPFNETFDEPRLKSNDSPTISEIYQMEGPAWENDKVGFRNYYDARNGIDIFGKKSSDMVLDSAGIRGHNYHKMSNWGMDILKVANSLGAGAIAIGIGDSLYRIGPCEVGNVRFITEGPVRAMLELTFEAVPAGDRKYNVKHLISINAGDRFYNSEVFIKGLQGDEKLVTGIVNKHECSLIEDEEAGMKLFGTLGSQAYTNEFLGLGLLVPSAQFSYNKTSPMEGDGITETYLVAINFTEDSKVFYSFFSGWEYENEGFKDQAFFIDQLKIAAKKIMSNVTVK